jgi:type II secretory pathway predicted ATPase ExeA
MQQPQQVSPEQMQQALTAVLDVLSGNADAQRILALTGQIEIGKKILVAILQGQLAIGRPTPVVPLAQEPAVGQGTDQSAAP